MTEETITGPAAAQSFGRVGEDGTVFLRLPDGSQRVIGQFAAGTPADALAFYSRRYEDLVTEIDLAAKRLADDRSTPAQAIATANRVREALAEPNFVGDLAALVSRVGQLEVLVNVKKAALAQQRAQHREQALQARKDLVEEADRLSTSNAWRVTTDRYSQLVEDWKRLPHADRQTEQGLWKTLAAARAAFDKRRKAHYQELESARDDAKASKESLIKEAEKLSGSRDWDATARAYRSLMDKWKKVGRAGKADDALWQSFREAQEPFFAARKVIQDGEQEKEQAALATKRQLADLAEGLLPIKNLGAAKRELRAIQDKWEKAGRVPRGDVRTIEGRLRKVEEAVRAADQDRWKKSNPELVGRASDTVEAFQAKVDKLERQLAQARESGDGSAAKKAEESLASANMLLAAARKGLARFK